VVFLIHRGAEGHTWCMGGGGGVEMEWHNNYATYYAWHGTYYGIFVALVVA
jgi:hypothetical protein